MNQRLYRTDFPAGAAIPESAVRGVLNRPSLTPPTGPSGASDGRSTMSGARADDARRAATSPRPLRRWSVAELVARAFARRLVCDPAH
jgi:hypothetical protein